MQIIIITDRPCFAVGSFLALFWYAIVWMKLVSYVQVNRWCRASAEKGEKESGESSYLASQLRYSSLLFLKIQMTKKRT